MDAVAMPGGKRKNKDLMIALGILLSIAILVTAWYFLIYKKKVDLIAQIASTNQPPQKTPGQELDPANIQLLTQQQS